jgi:hypothetical protein
LPKQTPYTKTLAAYAPKPIKQAKPTSKNPQNQSKSTPTTHQKATNFPQIHQPTHQNQAKPTPKSHQICKNGLGLLLKTHTLTPPRQAISLPALAATGVRTYATTPR